MISNDERCILQFLISNIYDYKMLYGSNFIFPLDTEEWKETYRGMCPEYEIPEDELESKYLDVLRIAREYFSHYNFEIVKQNKLEDEYSSAIGPFKVWLKCELIQSQSLALPQSSSSDTGLPLV